MLENQRLIWRFNASFGDVPDANSCNLDRSIVCLQRILFMSHSKRSSLARLNNNRFNVADCCDVWTCTSDSYVAVSAANASMKSPRHIQGVLPSMSFKILHGHNQLYMITAMMHTYTSCRYAILISTSAKWAWCRGRGEGLDHNSPVSSNGLDFRHLRNHSLLHMRIEFKFGSNLSIAAPLRDDVLITNCDGSNDAYIFKTQLLYPSRVLVAKAFGMLQSMICCLANISR
jgi:hypothetical protein